MSLPSVNDIIVVNCKGEWPSKSGGLLHVLYKLDYSLVEKLLEYDPVEISEIDRDIRGLRSYCVKNIPKGALGANEWHKVRNELVFALSGRLRWVCVDTQGSTREFILDGETAVFTPHHIIHTYEALDEDSAIGVLTNTLYFPDDSTTHDTYPIDKFPIEK